MIVMLYPCILCIVLLVYVFVFYVVCLTVFVNSLVKQFAICFGVVAILLLNFMAVFSVGGYALLWIDMHGLPKNVCVVPVIPVCI